MTDYWYKDLLSVYYLIGLIMLVIALLGLVISLHQIFTQKRTTIRVTFVWYFIAILVQGVIPIVYVYLGYKKYFHAINMATEYFFSIIEFVAFGILFKNILTSQKAIRLVRGLLIIFPVVCLFWLPASGKFSSSSFQVSIVSSFIMLGVSLRYFYELFLYPPTKKLTYEPSFWIATGILLYLVCLIPNLLAFQFVKSTEYWRFEVLGYVSLLASSMLYIFFIKALLCKTYPAASVL